MYVSPFTCYLLTDLPLQIKDKKRIAIDSFNEVCAMATMGNDIHRKADPRYPAAFIGLHLAKGAV
jgi:hypothetical protein